jgi:hypothetical protein
VAGAPPRSLARAAEEWLARGRTQKRSSATETARRQDLVAVASRLADRLGQEAVVFCRLTALHELHAQIWSLTTAVIGES